MTQDQIQWLVDPAIELQNQVPGTLILMENKDRVLFLAGMMDKPGDALKIQLLPRFNVKSIRGMIQRNARFALM